MSICRHSRMSHVTHMNEATTHCQNIANLMSTVYRIWSLYIMYVQTFAMYIYTLQISFITFNEHSLSHLEWLRWVEIQVSLQNTGLFCRALLQKRPIFWTQPIAFGVPFNLNLHSQSHSSLFWCHVPLLKGSLGLTLQHTHLIGLYISKEI